VGVSRHGDLLGQALCCYAATNFKNWIAEAAYGVAIFTITNFVSARKVPELRYKATLFGKKA
jgi:hypothetical protein